MHVFLFGGPYSAFIGTHLEELLSEPVAHYFENPCGGKLSFFECGFSFYDDLKSG